MAFEFTGGTDYGSSGWTYFIPDNPPTPGQVPRPEDAQPYTIVREKTKNNTIEKKLVILLPSSPQSSIGDANAKACGADVLKGMEGHAFAGAEKDAVNVYTGITWTFRGKDANGNDKDYDCSFSQISSNRSGNTYLGQDQLDNANHHLGVDLRKQGWICRIYEAPPPKKKD